MRLKTTKWYTREMARRHPRVLFVFGDNMRRAGMGGQAAALRGEPNAVGIPTKWAPGRRDSDYFNDGDLEAVKDTLDAEFARLEEHLRAGGTVVWPKAGIGTGLSQLPQRAPRIQRYIRWQRRRLRRIART